MKINIEKAEALIHQLKLLIKEQKAQTKFSDKLASMDPFSNSQKSRDSVRRNLESASEQLIRIEHECHCLAVDLGIAEMELDRYGEFEVNRGWHRVQESRRKPAAWL